MGFIINTNISAMNSHYYASKNAKGLDKSLNSLSTGHRINKAADDAAGIALTSKLSAQSKGLGQAIKNANDGIGLIQTADGALEEMGTILQRIRVLAIAGSNDTQDGDSRSYLTKEIGALSTEFSDIVNTTKYNGIKLLDGSSNPGPFVGAGLIGSIVNGGGTQNLTNSTVTGSIFNAGTLNATNSSITGIIQNSGTLTVTGSTLAGGVISADAVITNGVLISGSYSGSLGVATGPGGGDFTFHTGAYSNETQKVAIGNASMSQLNSDGGGFGFVNTNPTTQADFEQLIKDMDDTIVGLNGKRATIGAAQNKLESTMRNISVTQVNIESARSQIQDVDFADESANFAKHNIITQSGSYAMSQANANQSNVLILFQ